MTNGVAALLNHQAAIARMLAAVGIVCTVRLGAPLAFAGLAVRGATLLLARDADRALGLAQGGRCSGHPLTLSPFLTPAEH